MFSVELFLLGTILGGIGLMLKWNTRAPRGDRVSTRQLGNVSLIKAKRALGRFMSHPVARNALLSTVGDGDP